MSADAAQQPEQNGHTGNGDSLVVPSIADLLASLRGIAGPCEPPIGVGAFDVLYVNAREVVVWYSPVRPEHQPGEVTIPMAWVAAAWEALTGGEALDEASLTALCEGRAGGARWVQALLAQAPGVVVPELTEGPLVLTWSVSAWQAALERQSESAIVARRGRTRRHRSPGTRAADSA